MKEKSSIIVDVVILLAGICLLLFASEVTSLVSIIIGSLLILYGVYQIVGCFTFKVSVISKFRLMYGVIAVVFGIVFVVKTSFLKELISFIIGAYIVLASIFKMQEAMLLKDVSDGYKRPLIVSSIGLLIGVLCLFGKFIVPDMVNMVIGLMLIIYSVLDIVASVMIEKSDSSKSNVKDKKKKEQVVIDMKEED